MNLLSTLLSSLVNQGAGYTAAGVIPGILGNRHPSIAPYETFPTADRPMVVAVGNDRQFTALCAGLELPELPGDPRFASNADRVGHIDELASVLTSRLITRSAAQWSAILAPLGVPCGPVNDLAGAFDLAETLGLEPTIQAGDGADAITLPANPIGLSGTGIQSASRPPRLGEHTAELAAWLEPPHRDPSPHPPSVLEQIMTTATPMRDPLDLLDTSSLLEPEERDIQAVVGQFVADNLRPHVGDWFENAHFPREMVAELGKLGVLGMHLQGYGCAGVNAVSYGLACLELEAADSGFRSFVSVQGSLSMYSIWRYGSEEQKLEWLPRLAAGEAIGCFGLTEPDFGSNPSDMRCRAVQDGSDWILNGSKMWITNGGIADVATVWAMTDDGVRGFLLPRGTPGFTTNDIKHKMSLRASITSELAFDDVRLPASAVLPEAKGLGAPLSCLSEARFGILFGAVGAARDCLQSALNYGDSRVQFGRKINGFQLTQKKLADMAVALNSAMLLAIHLGRLKEAGRIRPEQISVGKLNNVSQALAIARECRTILGANGISLEYSPLRHANNLESVLTYEGTSEIHTLVIGQALTGLPAYR